MPIDATMTLNEPQHRFELIVDGHMAYEVFERFAGGIAYVHTLVPKALEGRGVGSALVRQLMDYARREHLLVRPDCSFVKAWLGKHPEYQDLSLAHGAKPEPRQPPPYAPQDATLPHHPQPAEPLRIPPRRAEIGGGLAVARALPSRHQRTIGAWCFLDHAGPAHFGPGHGMRVGPHPHIGLQTFTWMLEGQVLHRDSLGHRQLIRPGQVNLMTAGHGISHSEESADGETRLHTAQLWIALPARVAEMAPRFDHYPELPRWQAQGVESVLLVGEFSGRRSPVAVHSPLLGLDLFSAAGAELTLPLDPAFEHGLMPLAGPASAQGEALAADELLYLPPGAGTLRLELPAGTRALLIGGAPFGEDITIWWNFVGHGKPYIAQAQRDWQAHSERFGEVHGFDGPRIEAPPVPWAP